MVKQNSIINFVQFKMAKPKLDRKVLLQNSLSVFKKKGYSATSMQDLAEANGLLKGSMYHYVESKEALMFEVLTALKDYYVNKVFAFTNDANNSPYERLCILADKAEEIFTFEEGGDFFVNIGLETLNTHPKFLAVIHDFFHHWFQAMQKLYLEIGISSKQAKIKAEAAVAEIEGAVMLMRLIKDKHYLRQTLERLKQNYRTFEHENKSNNKKIHITNPKIQII